MNLHEAILFARKKFTAQSIASASLDAEVLLLEAVNRGRRMKRDKSWLYLCQYSYHLSEKEESRLRAFVKRRARHEPVAYILGRKEFYGLDFYVDKSVLIPRSDTEVLVDKALEEITAAGQGSVLMDLGTGSGCIPIALLKTMEERGQSDRIRAAYADDISADALRVAKKNAKKHGVEKRIEFLRLDLEKALEKLPPGEHILLTANLPYIKPENYPLLPDPVRRFEPKIALTAPEKGLYHIRRLLEKFSALKNSFAGYSIFLEADPAQMRSIASMAKKNLPGCQTETFSDLRWKKRVMKISGIRQHS
jgi:release factor glutamine methyltransferase